MKHIKTLFLVITALFSQPLLAQQGPVIGCAECDATNNKAVPVSGNWYNPEQSGTGYILDVKKGRVVGLYFGYDEQGKALWLSFLGELQASADENVVWTLEAPLVKYSGGNTFNQAHRFPNQIEATGDVIKLDFHFAHYASVQINNGSVQHLIPLNYGVETKKEFKETDHLFPNLEGIWTLFLDSGNENVQNRLYYQSPQFYISQSSRTDVDGTKTVGYYLWDTESVYETVPMEHIICSNPIKQETGQREVKCKTRVRVCGDNVLDPTTIAVAPANIGPNHIYIENSNCSFRFRAFRVSYLSDPYG